MVPRPLPLLVLLLMFHEAVWLAVAAGNEDSLPPLPPPLPDKFVDKAGQGSAAPSRESSPDDATPSITSSSRISLSPHEAVLLDGAQFVRASAANAVAGKSSRGFSLLLPRDSKLGFGDSAGEVGDSVPSVALHFAERALSGCKPHEWAVVHSARDWGFAALFAQAMGCRVLVLEDDAKHAASSKASALLSGASPGSRFFIENSTEAEAFPAALERHKIRTIRLLVVGRRVIGAAMKTYGTFKNLLVDAQSLGASQKEVKFLTIGIEKKEYELTPFAEKWGKPVEGKPDISTVDSGSKVGKHHYAYFAKDIEQHDPRV
jgi:hypothetical protein